MSEWIKCSERLPEFDEHVLVCTDWPEVGFGKLMRHTWLAFFGDVCPEVETWEECNVKYWMPLPLAPKDKPMILNLNLFDAGDLANIKKLIPNRNITLENGGFFCDEVLSDEERIKITEYMANKVGIELSPRKGDG